MIIPWQEIDKETLYNLVQEFVLREGTDYGEQEFNLSDKVEQVLSLIRCGKAKIVYSELHESVDIQLADKFLHSTTL